MLISGQSLGKCSNSCVKISQLYCCIASSQTSGRKQKVSNKRISGMSSNCNLGLAISFICISMLILIKIG